MSLFKKKKKALNEKGYGNYSASETHRDFYDCYKHEGFQMGFPTGANVWKPEHFADSFKNSVDQKCHFSSVAYPSYCILINE